MVTFLICSTAAFAKFVGYVVHLPDSDEFLAGAIVPQDGVTVYGAGVAAGRSETSSFGVGTKRSRACTVSIVLTDAKVSRVSYSGQTGSVLTKGEQCAYAVENRVK